MLKKKFIYGSLSAYLIFSALLMLTCDSNLGPGPVGPPVEEDDDQSSIVDTSKVIPVDSITSNMQISVSPSVLKASLTDEASISVSIFDVDHNPVSGKKVSFISRKGFISKIDSITDAAGNASATYRAVRMNTVDTVFAAIKMSDTLLIVGQTVKLEGLTVVLSPVISNALRNTNVPVNVTVLDGLGMPVPDAPVALTGTLATKGKTSSDGVFTTSVESSTAKTVKLTASALGSSDSASVRFWSTLPDTVTAVSNKNLRMRVFSSKTQMRADNSDSSIITVVLINDNGNPEAGQKVRFSSTMGIVCESAVVDPTGRANGVLRSSPENGTCTVTVSADGLDLSAQTKILFSGVNLKLSSGASDLKTGEKTRVDAVVKDGSGNPVSGYSVTFMTSGGTFQNGKNLFETDLDPNGKASVELTSSTAGKVEVTALAQNSSDQIEIRFSTNTLTLTSSPSTVTAGGKRTSTITALYVDGSGKAVSNALIIFAANAGLLSEDSVRTGANGRAVTTLAAGTFAGTATVEAVAANGTASTKVTFKAAPAASVKLAITPDNIGVNGGVATLIATVKDAQGNMVSGASVNFRILKGPGGGEHIDKPLAVSNEGTATTHLLAGSQPSQYRACEVVASVGTISDTSKLTISGEPYIITVSRPEDDTVTVPNGGNMDQTTFNYFVGAVVQDINGNPVADGTKVHFSAVISGMMVGRLILDHWAGVGSAEEKKAVLDYCMKDIPFEDINNNLRMDPAVDLKLDGDNSIARRGDDVNGDGVCDYDGSIHDFFYDFNGNGVCDPDVGEPVMDGYPDVYADLNRNGLRDTTELITDHNGNGIYDGPASGDFRFGLWEMRTWFDYLEFHTNDFAVAIAASAETKAGVAYAKITYPRQFANRLIATINAEANGIRDRDGERFGLPVVR